MYTIDDAMLTLILRFAGRKQDIAFSSEEFILKQRRAIQKYVEKFPPDERKSRALEWIAVRARQYRKMWEAERITSEASRHRCADCPLSGPGDSQHCRIHSQWLELLRQYAASELTSREYIESALDMLARHKEHLRIRHGRLAHMK